MSPEHHAIAEARTAPDARGLGEGLVEDPADRFDHPHGRHVVRLGRDLDEREADRPRLSEHRAQRGRGVAAALLPGHDRVADVAEAVRGKIRRARLPPDTDAARELAVPEPAVEAGEPGDQRPVGQLDGRTLRLAIVQAREERPGIGTDALEVLLRRRRTADVVAREPALEGVAVAREILLRGSNEMHGATLDGANEGRYPSRARSYRPRCRTSARQRSPRRVTRAGTVSIRWSSTRTPRSTSSQVSGVDTAARGCGRTE